MNEIRKVIGICDHIAASRNGVAFPSVLAWIRGANDYVTQNLVESFPDRGTVYLHVSACDNVHPHWNHVGLFECVESPGQSAAWKVNATSKHLARVIAYPKPGKSINPLALMEWLSFFRENNSNNILLGSGLVYIRQGNLLVGPFSTSDTGKLLAREQTFTYEGLDVIGVEIAGRHQEFVDVGLLPKGKPIILDPKEAVQKRLKFLSRANHLEWLSRAKVQELSAALATNAVDDGAEWVVEHLPGALEALVSAGALDEKIGEEILQIKGVDAALTAVWKKAHAEEVKRAQEEIETLKKQAGGIRQSIGGLNNEVDRVKGEIKSVRAEKAGLEKIMLELQAKIEAAKAEAREVFEAELKRLAQSPVSMALLGAWVGGSHKSAERSAERSEPLIRIQRPVAERPQAVDLKSAIFNNLKSCNLSPLVASELTAVCRAALAAGQPIAFRSLFADLLADGVASALGQLGIVWADVPAGLLDPVDWERLISSEHKGCPRILQNANRSDIPLVLGSLRRGVLEQALGNQNPDGVVLMTLEANAEMRVTSDYPLGPLIDERVLRFNAGKAVVGLSAFPEFAKQLPTVGAVTAEEFAEIGDGLRRLPLFALSAHETVFRRAFAALRDAADKPADAPRLFFKYWCLPRCGPEDVVAVLEAHKETWGNDKSLMDLREALNRNG
jgi:hypothetical protein